MSYGKHVKTVRDNKALQSLLLGNSLILISLGMLVPIYALFVEEVGVVLYPQALLQAHWLLLLHSRLC